MTNTFESKVRLVGDSLGILIPKEIAKEKHIKKGEKVMIAVIKKDVNLIKKAFGSAKQAKGFEREHIERTL